MHSLIVFIPPAMIAIDALLRSANCGAFLTTITFLGIYCKSSALI